MKVLKCINGHFFDADKYELCPHCNATPASEGNISGEGKRSFSFFSPKKKENATSDGANAEKQKIGKTVGIYDSVSDVRKTTETNSTEEVNSLVLTPAQDDKLIEKNAHTTFTEQDKAMAAQQPIAADDVSANARAQSQGDLVSAIKSVSSNTSGKTVGFFNAAAVNGVSNASSAADTEPVVGWLVCIKGAHFGESFNIVAGRNALGRDQSNKIVLSKDTQVSRSKHAWITYEPKKREFYIQPGESSGLSYLNDDNIMEPRKIAAHDKLELGGGTYIFLPLCGEDFSWEDVKC